MSGFPIIDLVVGIIFLYFLLSIISSAVIEIVLSVTRVRAKVLEAWFLQIFQTKIKGSDGNPVTLGRELLEHCSVTALSQKIAPAKSRGPSYIDAGNFVSALVDKLTANSSIADPKSIDDLVQSLETTTVLPPELKKAFLLYAHEARDTVNTVTEKTVGAMELFRGKLEYWYNSSMDRLTGAMKALYTRRYTIIAASLMTLFLNADTISISKYLYSNPEARAKVAVQVYETIQDENIQAAVQRIRTQNPAASVNFDSVQQARDTVMDRVALIRQAQALASESMPIGWHLSEFAGYTSGYQWALFLLAKLIGLAVTALAITMGAPFWFDVLNKVANLRGTGPKPLSPTATK